MAAELKNQFGLTRGTLSTRTRPKQIPVSSTMNSFCAFLLLGQIFSPHSVSTLPESEKAAIRDAAGTYWRSVGGTNVWLLPLVSWDMNPAGRPRPLTNWTRIVGRSRPQGNHLLIFQDAGRRPPVLVLSNLPPDRIRANRVNAYAVARGQVSVRSSSGAPMQVPLYDFGKLIDPPGRTNTAPRNTLTNSPR
jgi:hypothetical protein